MWNRIIVDRFESELKGERIELDLAKVEGPFWCGKQKSYHFYLCVGERSTALKEYKVLGDEREAAGTCLLEGETRFFVSGRPIPTLDFLFSFFPPSNVLMINVETKEDK